MIREERITEGHYYHIYNKNIEGQRIFSSTANSFRFLKTLWYYNHDNDGVKLSKLPTALRDLEPDLIADPTTPVNVKFVAYCVMPNHYHVLVKPLNNDCSHYISLIENSFTRYFNILNDRKGPLWQSRFQAKRIDSAEVLLHISRYIHLNPTSSKLVKRPEEWTFSSYHQYLRSTFIRNYLPEITISDAMRYKKFVEDQIDYQQRLKEIRNHLLD